MVKNIPIHTMPYLQEDAHKLFFFCFDDGSFSCCALAALTERPHTPDRTFQIRRIHSIAAIGALCTSSLLLLLFHGLPLWFLRVSRTGRLVWSFNIWKSRSRFRLEPGRMDEQHFGLECLRSSSVAGLFFSPGFYSFHVPLRLCHTRTHTHTLPPPPTFLSSIKAPSHLSRSLF